ATGVTFSGSGLTASITSVTSTSVAVTITISSGAAMGPRTITVTLPGGVSATLVNGFTVNPVNPPACRTTVSGKHTLPADVTGTSPITWVQFTLDGANLGTQDPTAPYSFIWDTRKALNGCHTLTAIAQDSAGNLGYSDSLLVNVAN